MKCCDANEIWGEDNHSLECKNWKETCSNCSKELKANEVFGLYDDDEPYCKECVTYLEDRGEYLANERADMEREVS